VHVYVTWRVERSLTGRAGEMEFGRALETHTGLISQRVSQLSRTRYTLVPFMASPITGALTNRRPASAAISSYSWHTEGHDKKNKLHFEIALPLRPLSMHPSSKDKISYALRASLNNFTGVRAFMNWKKVVLMTLLSEHTPNTSTSGFMRATMKEAWSLLGDR
jgi:hypothetical protein